MIQLFTRKNKKKKEEEERIEMMNNYYNCNYYLSKEQNRIYNIRYL